MEIKKAQSQQAAEPEQPKELPSKQSSGIEREQYYDRGDDLVERVRRAKEAAQRKMDEFGDRSEYEVRIVQGRKKRERPEPESGSAVEPES